MNRRLLASFAAIGALGVSGIVCPAGRARAATGSADQSVTYQINTAHTGSISGDGLAPPLVTSWSRDLGGPVSYPLIANGTVFVTVGNVSNASGPNYGSTLYALNEQTGATQWSAALPGTYYSSLAGYDNGRVFAVTWDGMVHAFEATTGVQDWSAQMTNSGFYTSPPIAVNGTLYVAGGSSGGTLYALDEGSGAVTASQSVMNGDDSSPAYSGSAIFVSYACPQTYAFSPSLTSLLWHYAGPCEGGGGATPVYANGNVYVTDTTSNSTGYVFNASSGALTGNFTANFAPSFSGATSVAISGISSSTGGTVRASDATGATLWSFAGDGALDTDPIIVNNDVYVASRQGNLYAVNLASGQQDWTASVGAPVQGSNGPLIGLGAGEGHLLVPAGHTLSAFVTAPPAVTASVFSGAEGAAFSGPVATFTDTAPTAGSDTAAIAWGDGTSSSGTIAANATGGYTVSGTHTYADEGAYSTTVTISTPAGTSSSASGSASVSDAALTSTGSTLSTKVSNTSFSDRVAVVTDGNPVCPIGDLSVSIAWGDGTTSTPGLSNNSSPCSFDVTGTHTYLKPATYTITTTATDVGGSTTTSTSSVTVVQGAPALTLSPQSLAFGNQSVGTTSPTQNVTITNTGNASWPVGPSSLVIGGANASDWSQTNTCGSSLAAGATCTVSLAFAPTASGARSAQLQVFSSNASSAQTVNLSGTGQTTDLGIAMTGPSKVRPGGALTYTISVKNNGPGPASGVKVTDSLPSTLLFSSISANGCTLPAYGTSGTITCPIGSVASGASASFTLNVTANAGRNSSVSNTASVSSVTLDPNNANNSATVTTLVSNK